MTASNDNSKVLVEMGFFDLWNTPANKLDTRDK
jgi:hypothetical protein